MAFSDELLESNRDVWDAMQSHRFVADILQDRLPKEVFARYLVYEGAFVGTAMAIFAYGLAKAPGLSERVWLAGVINALAREQIPYFEDRFADLGIDPTRFHPMPTAVGDFCAGMLKIAEEGGYADIVVAMLAAEWMYATWCGRAAETAISDPDLKRWVDLHAEPAFLAQAQHLRTEADAQSASASPSARDRLTEIFRQALELEIAFHAAPYETDD
jgi:thiaminase/transcriptional activator TenA